MSDIFDRTDAAFADVQTIAAVAAKPKAALADFVDAANLHLFAKRAVPTLYDGWETGSEGLERELVLDEKAIFGKGGCPALRTALATAGEHQDQAQWRQTCLAFSFLKNPRTLAHALNKGKGYSIAETEGMMDRVDADKVDHKGGLGWPGCGAFEQAGSKECGACPHRGKIRSPLNLGIVKAAPPVAPAAGAVTFTSNHIYPGFARYDLPDGYVFDLKGQVCKVVTITEKTAEGKEDRDALIPIFNNQYLLNPNVQQGPDAILFTVDGSKGELRPVMLERTAMASVNDTLKRLSEQGVAYNPPLKNLLGDFMTSLTRKIELIRQSTKARPFGWIRADEGSGDGSYDKFVYGKTFHRDGSVSPGGYLNEVMRSQYSPCGKIEPFVKAATFVLSQNRPEYNALLAGTFAAPMMQQTAQPLVLFSMFGDSGIGKSTVLKIAASVWGHPEDTRLTHDPTLNAAGHKMGMLANLPVMFDEVTEEPAMNNCLHIAMMDGNERARLWSQKSGLQMRESGHWATIMLTTGNRSLLDFVSSKQRDTAMGRYRVFEINVKKREGDDERKKRDFWSVDQYLTSLRFNFGQAGLIYAKFLAERSGELGDMVRERGREFDKLVDGDKTERFWSILCALLLLGAEFAKKLDLVQFDVPAMRDYLVEAFLKQREKLQADGQEGPGVAIELLSAFMKDHFQSMIVTDGLPTRGGSPGKMPFNVTRHPTLATTKGIHIQWVDRAENALLRISRDELLKWMVRIERQPSVIFGRIDHRVVEKVVLGGKTPYASLPERVIEFDVPRGSEMREVLCALVSRHEAEALTPATPGEQAILDAAAIARAKDNDHA